MQRHRWLYAWGTGSVAAGAASLLVPLYVVELGGNPFELGLLGAVAAFVGAPGAIVWGRVADRTKRRREVVLGSLAGVTVVLAAVPFVESIPVVVAANALLWLVFGAAGPILTLLVVADVPESEWNREIALLNTYQGYGWAGGLVLGLVWNLSVGRVLSPLAAQRALFWACALCGGLATVLLARYMPAPSERRVTRVDPRRVARLLSRGRRNVRSATFAYAPTRLYWSTRAIHPRRLADRFSPGLAAYFGAALLFFTGFAAFFAPLPLFLTEVGYTSDTVFGLYLVSSLGSAAFYSGAGRLSSRYDMRLLQVGALGTRGLAMPGVAVVGAAVGAGLVGLGVTAVAFAVVGLSWAVIAVVGTTIVTRLAPPALRGEALGVYTALSALAGGVGSLAGGALARQSGYTVAFGTAGVVIVVGAVVVAVLGSISRRTAGVDPTTAESAPATPSDADASESL